MGRTLRFRRRRRGFTGPLVLGLLALAALPLAPMVKPAAGALADTDANTDTGAFASARRLTVQPATNRVPRIVDGDTLWLGDEKIRLFGIDAPEMDQTCDHGGQDWACGRWSAGMLRDITSGGITCTGRDRDRYGRLLATCHAGRDDVAEAMVAAGAAMAYVRYSDAYSAIEAFARAKEAGIWGGPMTLPETHRRGPPQAPPADCAIKGNISANGRIYHMPGQENYADTRIDASRGEAWFCSAAEARAAGFRPARR